MSPQERIDVEVIQALGKHPTGLLSDAMDELHIPAALPPLSPVRTGQGRITGRAMTVRFEPKSGDDAAYRFGGGVGRPLEQVLQTMSHGDVVVMDLQASRTASAWGGLASRLAQRRGVQGTVLWGTCRDVEEIRSIHYPVWAVGSYPRRSRNEFTFGDILQPVQIGAVTIHSGDVIVADETGVVCVPKESAADALALARRIADGEASLINQIEEGNVVDWDQV